MSFYGFIYYFLCLVSCNVNQSAANSDPAYAALIQLAQRNEVGARQAIATNYANLLQRRQVNPQAVDLMNANRFSALMKVDSFLPFFTTVPHFKYASHDVFQRVVRQLETRHPVLDILASDCTDLKATWTALKNKPFNQVNHVEIFYVLKNLKAGLNVYHENIARAFVLRDGEAVVVEAQRREEEILPQEHNQRRLQAAARVAEEQQARQAAEERDRLRLERQAVSSERPDESALRILTEKKESLYRYGTGPSHLWLACH